MSTVTLSVFEWKYDELRKKIEAGAQLYSLTPELLNLYAEAESADETALAHLLDAQHLAIHRQYKEALRHLNETWMHTHSHVTRARALYRAAQLRALMGEKGDLALAYQHAQDAVHLFYDHRTPGTPEQCSWASALLEELDWRRNHSNPGWLRRTFHGNDPTILVGPANW